MSLSDFIKHLNEANKLSFANLPDKKSAQDFIDQLFGFLFIGYGKDFDATREYEKLRKQLEVVLGSVLETERIGIVSEHFFEELPVVYQALSIDADSILSFDPAAKSKEEVLLTYPGFYATAVYRLAHVLYALDVPVVPRLFAEQAHSKTGIDIHPGAQIGRSFAIDHGTGIVIGETAVIGNFVKIYQSVTLGALSVSKEEANKKRHPTIEDHVTIYSGATILGGETTVGHHTIVGGNVFLTNSVPSYSVVYHKSEVKVRDNNPFPEPLNFSI